MPPCHESVKAVTCTAPDSDFSSRRLPLAGNCNQGEKMKSLLGELDDECVLQVFRYLNFARSDDRPPSSQI